MNSSIFSLFIFFFETPFPIASVDVSCAGFLDLLVKALLVPPQVVDLAESLPAILADVFLHVGMNRLFVCLGALYFQLSIFLIVILLPKFP